MSVPAFRYHTERIQLAIEYLVYSAITNEIGDKP